MHESHKLGILSFWFYIILVITNIGDEKLYYVSLQTWFLFVNIVDCNSSSCNFLKNKTNVLGSFSLRFYYIF